MLHMNIWTESTGRLKMVMSAHAILCLNLYRSGIQEKRLLTYNIGGIEAVHYSRIDIYGCGRGLSRVYNRNR